MTEEEDYGGYAGRLRRLWTEEKARDRSVPDGSDKNLPILLPSALMFMEGLLQI